MNDNNLNNICSDDWEGVQDSINTYLANILFKIEWHYGDCRAPFFYPPEYNLIRRADNTTEYTCTIKLDLGENESLQYTSSEPADLVKAIKNDIDKKYLMTHLRKS